MILWTTWQECKGFISQSSIFYNLRTIDPVILNHNIFSDISIYNVSSSLNFKVYPWQNISYSLSSQLNKMDKSGFSVFWLTCAFSTSLCSFLLSYAICGHWPFSMLYFMTRIHNVTQILRENASEKECTIVKGFISMWSRNSWSGHYLFYFSTSEPDSFLDLPVKIQLYLYVHN